MFRLPVFLLLIAVFGLAVPAAAATAQADLFTVGGVKVEAAAESAISARDAAMAQGRQDAWTKLFRRLTPAANWRKEPALDEKALERLIRAAEVANERRSTTRYLADVTFHFTPNAVRNLLRRANITYVETRSPPVLVIPLIAGLPGFDPATPWANAWSDPALQEGLVPFIVPTMDDVNSGVLDHPDITQLDWAAVTPLARRYNAGAVILATASDDAKTVQMVELSPAGRAGASFAYAQSSFAADADAVAEKAEDAWKSRNAVDYAVRGRIVADVQFGSLDDWARIRSGLASVRSIAGVDIIGLALNEAEIGLTYSGRPEQLRDALAQQKLELRNTDGQFTLQLAAVSAANPP